MLRLFRHRYALRERSWGQSTVEFALTIPIFIWITIGVVDLGRGIVTNSIIANAAHEGARSGIYPSTPDADIGQGVNSQTAFLGNIPVASSDPGTGVYTTISPALASRASGASIVVTVHYRFYPITPVLSNLIGSNLNLNAASTMMIE